MANGIIQLIGTFKCAPTGDTLVDYSSVVSRASYTESRNMVTVPAVLSTAEETESPTSMKRTLNLTFHSTTASTSLLAVLREVINNDDAALDFELIENDDAVSASNPRYTGTAVLPQLEGMPDVGSLRQQTIALPITVWNTPDITP